jgi:hypothetical protein
MRGEKNKTEIMMVLKPGLYMMARLELAKCVELKMNAVIPGPGKSLTLDRLRVIVAD